jgi:multiple sugar transport system permease protein
MADKRGKKIPRRYLEGYTMLLPFALVFFFFVVIPVLWNFGLSFTHYNIMQPMRFAGFTNYIELLINDELFLRAVKNTLGFAVIAGPAGFLASFFFAWTINQLRARNAFSLAFYAPSIVSGMAVSIVWLTLFSSDRYGWINSLLLNLDLIKGPILWTKDPKYIMPLVIIISVWMSMGSGFLTNLAGLANLNPELNEAGQIDGVKGRFQDLIYIVIPQMKPYLLFNAIMAIAGSLNVYDITVAVAGFPSPDYSAHTIVAHLYDYGFIRFELGYASAIAFILFLLNFLIGRFFMKVLAEKD